MSALSELLDLLDLEPIEVNVFRGKRSQEPSQRVFGGQVIAQALVAAIRTVDAARPAHSLHAYFLRPGDPKLPILYEVEDIREGRSFSTRRVIAIQKGEPILSCAVDFQIVEHGFEHQVEMPAVPRPDALLSEAEIARRGRDSLPPELVTWLERARPLEIRAAEHRNPFSSEKLAPVWHCWIKTVGALGDDPNMHLAVLAYASDLTLFSTGMRPHGLGSQRDKLQLASLDHAIWFHRPFRIDDWLLYAQDSPSASGARTFNRGQIFDTRGALIASVAQEGLLRVRG